MDKDQMDSYQDLLQTYLDDQELLEYQTEKRKSTGILCWYVTCLIGLFTVLASLIAAANMPLGIFVLVIGLLVSISLWQKSRK